MKTIKTLTLALAAFAMASCCNSEPKQFVGTIVDGTMNTVTVKELTGDQTVVFSTEDADMTQANGLLIGNIATVDYKGKLKEAASATKVITDATYAKAVGKWTMPDPINPDSVMGICLMVEGEAESVNMATLRYTGWELEGEENKIVLKGVSEGSGEPMDFTQTAMLGNNADGAETLTIEGTEIVLTKHNL